ncbi:MAG: hypothetical protein JWP78_1368 [Mucilaginibacter sp.]|nr:hypothetical protein [Mucilaginibacter sp.]
MVSSSFLFEDELPFKIKFGSRLIRAPRKRALLDPCGGRKALFYK